MNIRDKIHATVKEMHAVLETEFATNIPLPEVEIYEWGHVGQINEKGNLAFSEGYFHPESFFRDDLGGSVGEMPRMFRRHFKSQGVEYDIDFALRHVAAHELGHVVFNKRYKKRVEEFLQSQGYGAIQVRFLERDINEQFACWSSDMALRAQGERVLTLPPDGLRESMTSKEYDMLHALEHELGAPRVVKHFVELFKGFYPVMREDYAAMKQVPASKRYQRSVA